jgi:serine/threonine-protein kinase HipA
MSKQNLDIYLHDKLAGKLSYEDGMLSFLYDSDYILESNHKKLSAKLPVNNEVHEHATVEAFFAGLLPEGNARRNIARYLNVSPENTFKLLAKLGGECAGAVSVYEEGESPEDVRKHNYKLLDDKQLKEMIASLSDRPLGVGQSEARISGAGAQNKLIASKVGGRWAIPLGNTPSSHIIKPGIRDVEGAVYNEYFCMQLAERMGLPVAESFIDFIDGEALYVTKRYDRLEGEDGGVRRMHQEDFCQALSVSPEKKYQNEGGPGLSACFALLENKIASGTMRGVDRLTFLRAVIFNFLIGNGDAHGKNFSILCVEDYESLAPLYDLMCTLIYRDQFSDKMAMKIGGQYDFDWVYPRHLQRMAVDIDIKPDYLLKQVKEMSERIVGMAHKLKEELNSHDKTCSDVYRKICKVITTNVSQVTS